VITTSNTALPEWVLSEALGVCAATKNGTPERSKRKKSFIEK
jgi:hypothetical protein